MFGAIEPLIVDVNDRSDLLARAAGRPELAPAERRAILSKLVDRIDLGRETVEIRIRPSGLPEILRGENGPRDLDQM